MAITISGENNNDRILASDGVLDSISGINAVGVVTATSFTGDLIGDVTGNLTGNVTGNINNTTLLLQTGGTERVRITSDGKIGIAESSPEFKLTVYDAGYSGVTIKSNRNSAADNIGGLHFKTRTTNVAYIQSLVDGTIKFRNTSSLTERLRIDSSGRLLINGATSNNAFSGGDDLIIGNSSGSTRSGITIVSNSSQDGGLYFSDGTSSGNAHVQGQIVYNHNGNYLRLYTSAAERLRITSGGSLGIANASPVFRVDIGDGTSGNDPASGYQFRINAYGDYIFALAKQSNASFSIRNNSTSVVHLNTQNSKRLALGVSTGSNSGSIEEHVTIKAGGNMGLGTNNPQSILHIEHSTPGIRLGDTGNSSAYAFFDANAANAIIHADKGNSVSNSRVAFAVDNSEKARIDSSGNFNLGLTASPVSSSTEQGVFLAGADSTQSVISSNVTPFVINRMGTGGNNRNCIEFRNNGVLRGTIGAIGASNGIFFQSGTQERMRITSGGSVNINGQYTQTAHSLSVNSNNGSCVIIGNTSGTGSGSHDAQIVASHGSDFDNLKLTGHAVKIFTNHPTGLSQTMGIDRNGYVTKPFQPRAFVKIYGNTTLSNGKVTNWASPQYNVGSLWDTSNKRFVAPVNGLYMVGGNFRIGAPGKIRVVRFEMRAYNSSHGHMATYGGGFGGTHNYDGGSSGYDHPYVSFVNVIPLEAAQYLELWLGETSTEHTSYIQDNNEQSHLWCVLLQ